MTPTWRGADPPARAPITPAGWLRVAVRGTALGLLTFGGLGLMLILRLIERPLFGLERPWTPGITRAVCTAAFPILGIGFRQTGRPMRGPGAAVANHSSWLDIFALNARKRIYFVSKSEVAAWPGIGWLARATGTVFIARKGTEAKAQADVFAARLKAGHRLMFFPEGTSTDGQRVLPFKSTLFAAFFVPDLREIVQLQPVTVIWRAPSDMDPRFYGWWGDMDFGGHLLAVMASPRQGSVEVVYHSPLRVADFPDRKALALACEASVRAALPPSG